MGINTPGADYDAPKDHRETTSQLEAIKDHVERMKTPVDNHHRKCIDGGYREQEAPGALACAGGDLGISLVLLSMGYEADQALQLVKDFEISKSESYGWHTDTHEGHECEVGCGHCNAAIMHALEYGVQASQVRELLQLIRSEQKQDSDHMECIILDREHHEQAILVVEGTEYTVKPRDEERNRQFFIYDKTRHLNLLHEFADFCMQHGSFLDLQQLIHVSDQQTVMTLGLLTSSQGKPMYSINADGDQVVIEFIGNAPIW